MAKKVKPEIISGIIQRIVRLKGIECVPVTDMGKFATVFKRSNYERY